MVSCMFNEIFHILFCCLPKNIYKFTFCSISFPLDICFVLLDVNFWQTSFSGAYRWPHGITSCQYSLIDCGWPLRRVRFYTRRKFVLSTSYLQLYSDEHRSILFWLWVLLVDMWSPDSCLRQIFHEWQNRLHTYMPVIVNTTVVNFMNNKVKHHQTLVLCFLSCCKTL